MIVGPSFVASSIGLLAALAFALLANWQSRLPYEKRIRMVPWLGIQFFAFAVSVILLAHLVSLGTGHDFLGRRSGN